MNKEEAKDKAKEPITLPRAELWMLRIAAATGVVGVFSHAPETIADIINLLNGH